MKTIGKYTVLGELAKGGSGVVYRAIDPLLEREVAIKTQPIGVVHDDESVQRFLREARLAAALRHRNVVTIFDMGRHANGVYIVMELLRGEDLCSLLRERRHLSLEKKLRIVMEVAGGLAHAHRRGVVHRDVKPRNVFLTEDGNVKLLDFGLAHVSQSTLTKTGQVMGTPHYMSPEQVMGRKIDHRSDVFSLGAVLYELVTGEKAFGAPTLTKVFDRILEDDPEPMKNLAPAVAEELSRIVGRMTRKVPAERYADLDEVLRDLARFSQELEVRKRELRSEVGVKAKTLQTLLPQGRGTSEEFLEVVDRKDLSFMALLGLRDGIDLELWRLRREAESPAHEPEEPGSEALARARALLASGELGGSLVVVSEALRLSPGDREAGELAEEVRRSIVERASRLDDGSADVHLDVAVAALLAFDERGAGGFALPAGPGEDRETIAKLSEFLLSGLPEER